MKYLSIAALVLATSGTALAQHKHHTAPAAGLATTPATTPAAAETAAKAPDSFASALSDYQRFRADEPAIEWRRANDAMEALGGHVGQLRGQPRNTDSAKPAHQHGKGASK